MATGQENKARFIDELGSVAGDEYYKLYSYWIGARFQLEEYKELFGDKKTVKMLNAIGTQFFGNIQQIMLDNLILHITRLTDNPKSGGYRNLSIESLQIRIENDRDVRDPGRFRDSESRAELDRLVKTAQGAADFARLHRDKRLAHLDRDTIMGYKSAKQLSPIVFNELEHALNSIFEVVRFVHSKMYPGSDLMNELSYQSGTGHFLARERLRTGFLCHLDSIIDPDMKSERYSDELALSFYDRFNVDLRGYDYDPFWKRMHLFMDFQKEVDDLRDKGICGPPTDRP